ncbi:hypothetical protein KIW84_012714 [Lathyrus oleraceus]|uniref:Uncharacterized protein n=1 Tax=Pisum sativum TaxID=3888 RepID=A0A9D5BIJ3_PEA|nr:hypothetical protein KIW84_012714 [Pisum sativum]
MASSRKLKGKAKMGEGTSNPTNDSESVAPQPTMMQRRLQFPFRNRALTLVKYGNLASFPATSFNFNPLLRYQGITNFIRTSTFVYPDLAKDFYAKLSLSRDCTLSSHVKKTDIVLSLEDFGKCLGVPFEGARIRHSVVCDDEGFENYEKFAYYFSISRISEQELASRNASSERLHLYSATLSVSDCMLYYLIAYILLPKHSNHSQISDVDMQLIFAIKNRIKMTERACEISVKATNKKMGIFIDNDGLDKHIEQPIPPPNVAPTLIPTLVPEGGFSNEFLYNHMRGMEERINLNIYTRFDNLHTEFLTALANQNQDESEEEMDEGQA